MKLRKTETQQYNDLAQAVEQSRSDRQEREKVWRKHEEMYSGRFETKVIDPVEQIFPNMVLPTMNIIVAATLGRAPDVAITARKNVDAPRARLQQALNKYFWDVLDTQTVAQEGLRDAGIYGLGVLKTIWNYEEQLYVEPNPDDVRKMVERRDELSKVLGFMPTDQMIYDFLKKQSFQIIDNRPLARRVSPKEIWIDSQAKSIREINWIVHEYHRPLEDVEADEWFDSTQRKSYRDYRGLPEGPNLPNYRDTYPLSGDDRRSVEGDTSGTQLIRICELWDLRRRKLYVCRAEDLGNAEKLLWHGYFPYAIGQPFTFMDLGPAFRIPDTPYSLSLVEMIGPEQYELTMIARELMRQRFASRRKFAARSNAITDEVADALTSDIDGDIAKIDYDGDIREVLMPLPGLTVDPALYTQHGLVKEMIQEKSGITGAQRGDYAGARTSATEVSAIEDYAQGRTNLLVHAVQVAMVDLARKMIGLAAQYMTTKHVARIADVRIEDLPPNVNAYESNGELVYPFDKDDIAGEYDFSVSIVNAQADTPQARAQKLLQFAQTFAASGYVNWPNVIKEYSKEIGIPEPERFIMDPTLQAQEQQGVASQPGVPGLAPGGGQPPGQGRQLAAAGAMGGVQQAASAGRRAAGPAATGR